MGDLLIRGVPAETHEELKRRADAAGTSLQAYVRSLLDQHTSKPSMTEWIENLGELPRHPTASGADAVRAARDELP